MLIKKKWDNLESCAMSAKSLFGFCQKSLTTEQIKLGMEQCMLKARYQMQPLQTFVDSCKTGICNFLTKKK